MRERKSKTGINRLGKPSSRAKRVSNIRTIREYDLVSSKGIEKHHKKIKQYDEKLKYFDERYSLVVKVFMNEIFKRNISIDDPELESKIDEIVSSICEGKYYQTRFAGDNIEDVKNTILRKVNTEKQKTKAEER